MDNLKASIVHKAICLTALLVGLSPALDLTKVALSRVCNQMTDQELSHIAKVWKETPHRGREAVFHAAHSEQSHITLLNASFSS